MLMSSVLSYVITTVPFLSKPTLLYNPLSGQWLLIFAVFSVVQFVVAYFLIAGARIIYLRDAARARRGTFLVLVAASLGVAVTYLWSVLATAVANGNLFMSFVYSPNTTLIPPLGFILAIAGALISDWEAGKTSQ
jgi:cytochrome bd-type quinol oxidase subunit 2